MVTGTCPVIGRGVAEALLPVFQMNETFLRSDFSVLIETR
jgi:hypothetical protein